MKKIVSELNERSQFYMVDLNTNKDGFYFNKNNIIYFTNDLNLKNVQLISNNHVLKLNKRAANNR